MRHKPLVSVIIPAHNEAKHISATLSSVLNQTYRNLEVLVVDDGSSDNTVGIVQRFARKDSRLQLLQQANRGVANARNLGAEQSNGTFLAPIDADDVWAPQKIERQVDTLLESPSAGLSYCWWVGINGEGQVTGKSTQWMLEGNVLEPLICVNFVGNASVPLFRRECFEDVGGYVSHLSAGGQGCEDWDLTLRIAENYEFRLVPAYLAGYRSVDGSMSQNAGRMARSYHLVVNRVRQEHPDLPDELYRWSRTRFYAYLASTSYNSGAFSLATKWIWRALMNDPAAFACISYLKIFFKSIVRQVAQPITSQIWPDQQSWREFRRRTSLRPDPRDIPLDEFPSLVDEKPSWDWKPYKPYDRIRMRRWNRVLSNVNGEDVSRISSST